jgi:hypothetical protein
MKIDKVLLTSGEWSDSNPDRFTPSIHRIAGWVGPRAGLEAVEKRKLSCSCQESNAGHSARRYTDWAIPAPTETLRSKHKNEITASNTVKFQNAQCSWRKRIKQKRSSL